MGESERAFDWKRLHSRLEASRLANEQRFAPDENTRCRILRDRAKLLAREPARTDPPQGSMEIVEFLLAYEHYGLEVSRVREVCPLRDLRALPGTPVFVLGLMALRGQVLSVIDLKRFFDLPQKGLTDLNRVLILSSGVIELGILADAILQVRPIALANLQPALPGLTGNRADFVKGISEGPLVVLDADKLLTNKRIIVGED